MCVGHDSYFLFLFNINTIPGWLSKSNVNQVPGVSIYNSGSFIPSSYAYATALIILGKYSEW